MRLSDLQTKELIDIIDGKRIGTIIDIVINNADGKILTLIIEESKRSRKFINNREEREIGWNQIKKIGEDIILVETKK